MSDTVLLQFAGAIERNDLNFIQSLLLNRDADANARLSSSEQSASAGVRRGSRACRDRRHSFESRRANR